jgi:hypothetical protein
MFFVPFLSLFHAQTQLLGELEETLSRSYTRSANLRAIMYKSECPQALRHCQAMFEKFLNPQIRDTLTTDMLSSILSLDEGSDEGAVWNENVARTMPSDLYGALRASVGLDPPRKAYFLSHLTKHGLTYTVRAQHAGNSCVLIGSEGGKVAAPARIEYIVQLPSPEGISTFIGIRRYKPVKLSDDPFLRFPFLQTRMWSAQSGNLEIISLDHICAHFAQLSAKWEGEEVVIVSSMSRVSYSPLELSFISSQLQEY